MLNDKYNNSSIFKEKKGCIEIGDNVYIGFGVTIMPNVRIVSNVVIGAMSVVTKDINEGGVYVGIPAHRIMDFDKFVDKNLTRSRDKNKSEQDYWKEFYTLRNNDYS